MMNSVERDGRCRPGLPLPLLFAPVILVTALLVVWPGWLRTAQAQSWVSEEGGGAQVDADLRALIRRMSADNPLWGAPVSMASCSNSALKSLSRASRSTWSSDPGRQTRLELLGGFEVFAAGDSESGCELAVTEHPDVILMDLEMPVVDRWEPVRRLRSDPHTHDIPIIGMSAHALASERETAIAPN